MEREGEEDQSRLNHFIHEHPLSLIETHAGDACYGCMRYFTTGETAYGCRCWRLSLVLHEECAEMPREIRHSKHPQHTLILKGKAYDERCIVCSRHLWGLGYFCPNTSTCHKLWIDLGCAASMGVDATADAPGEKRMQHPSHPQHELELLTRPSSFKCDACGGTTTTTGGKGSSSYICTTCQYWIHESCASLPSTMELREYFHIHPISLAFRLPIEYIKFDYKCDICSRTLPVKHWVYHCYLCSYVVHIKCAVDALSSATTSINNEDEDVMQFPIDDISEELIRPFVMRERGEIVIPQDGGVINNRKYWFHNHHHELSLISLEENDDNNDDNDHPYNRRKSELICDGCITPIYPKKAHESSSSSSSSSDKHNYYCMSCSDCKYFLHLACFHSPLELPSLPLLHQHDHKLILKTFPKLEFSETRCSVCHLSTNGLLYACTECDFMADIKCASMPDTIKHTAHQRHHHRLKLVNNEPEEADYAFKLGLCGACGGEIHLYNAFYRCDSCEFNLHIQCVLLPATKKLRAWDKHMLPLTYDANINHPGEFYCDICEKGMNPKEWMYHCRECDHSFHLNCLPTTSGRYRNIKLGQQCVINHQYDHYFTFQVITTKRRCDTCPSPVYGKLGFQCTLCNFAMCFEPCSRKHIDGIEIID